MAITKVTSGLISADASSIDLNIDAGTLYLDVSENRVGIGTTSPSSVLEVTGTGDVNTGILTTHSRSGVGYTLRLNNTNNGANKGSGIKWSSGGFDTGAIIIRSDATAASGDAPAYMTFHTSADGTESINERMRITSSGNVGIGQTSPNVPLEIQSATPAVMLTDSDTGNSGVIEQDGTDLYYGNSSSSGTHIFKNNSSNRGRPSVNGNELMRIDSSGRVGIAQDTPGDFNAAADDLVIGNSGGDFGITIRTGTASNGSIHFADGTAGDAPNRGIITYDHSDDHMQFNVAGSERMRIQSNGRTALFQTTGGGALTIRGEGGTSFIAISFTHNSDSGVGYIQTAASSVTYSTSSDYRLKENVVPMENGLERIQKLKPVKFNWKLDGEESEGFLAHEVQEAGWNDGVTGSKDDNLIEEGKQTYQGMDYGRITPLLVKAIQEQQTIIDNLTTRIETLENA